MKKIKDLLKVILLSTLVVLVGCSANTDKMSVTESITNEKHDMEAYPEDLKENGMSDNIQVDTTIDNNRKIIRTGHMVIETKAFDETVQELMDTIADIKGYVAFYTIDGGGVYSKQRQAQLTLRIPKQSFDSFMNDTQRYGNVISKSVESQDITDQYVDTTLRLATLEAQAKRLGELLDQAGNLEDLFKIEQELARVTYEIERFKGTLTKYDSLVDYATLNITIYETKTYQEIEHIPDTFLEKIQAQFQTSSEAVVNLLKTLVLTGVALVPFISIIGLPIIGLILLIKKLKKHKSNK